MMTRKLISVTVPAYNESACVDELARQLTEVFDSLADRYDFEAIICDNGSQDNTFEKLVAIRERDPRFKILQLAHNFGQEGAVSACLTCASGDAAIIMNADLQDPPSLIPRFLERWEEGYDNVYAVITKRHDAPVQRRFLTAIYYRLLNRASGGRVPEQVSDFRLVDRCVYEGFNNVSARFRVMRVIWAWLATRSIGVEHERPARFDGRSTFNYKNAIFSAIVTLLSISPSSFRWVGPFGILLAVFSFLLLAGSAVRAFVWGVPFNGFETIVGLDCLLFGFLFFLDGCKNAAQIRRVVPKAQAATARQREAAEAATSAFYQCAATSSASLTRDWASLNASYWLAHTALNDVSGVRTLDEAIGFLDALAARSEYPEIRDGAQRMGAAFRSDEESLRQRIASGSKH